MQISGGYLQIENGSFLCFRIRMNKKTRIKWNEIFKAGRGVPQMEREIFFSFLKFAKLRPNGGRDLPDRKSLLLLDLSVCRQLKKIDPFTVFVSVLDVPGLPLYFLKTVWDAGGSGKLTEKKKALFRKRELTESFILCRTPVLSA